MRQIIICGAILVLTVNLTVLTQAQWESSSGTFQTVSALAMNNGTLYSSEGVQVYKTTDQGNSWTPFGTGLPVGTPGLVNDFASNGVDIFAGNEETVAGSYKVTFDTSRLASGVYLYRLTTENFTATKKLVLMR